jgi:hypothetical protein
VVLFDEEDRMGSVFPRKNRWWIKFKLRDGRWKPKATPYLVDNLPTF